MESTILFITVCCLVVAIPPCIESIFNLVDRRKGAPVVTAHSLGSDQGRNRFKRLIHTIYRACIVLFVILGIIVVILANTQVSTSNNKNTELQLQVSNLLSNEYKDVAPKNVIERQTFRNERVLLDGNKYVDCNFYFVTFVYEGKRPFIIEYCHIYSPSSLHWPEEFHPAIGLLYAMGAIDTNKLNVDSLKREVRNNIQSEH